MNDHLSKVEQLTEKLRGASASPVATAAATASPAVEPTCDASSIEFDSLLKRCMNKPAFAMKVLEMFHKCAGAQVESIAAAVASNQREDARRAAHKFKGTAATVAAEPLAAAAGMIEAIARAGEEDLTQALATLRHEADRCIAALPAVTARLAQAQSPAV